ncbi:hypothetical protein HDU86_003445 [Geranomyces michiganensis]|nr:hypothetical protein HDU86_003445 [Geranomyces michiganensis]
MDAKTAAERKIFWSRLGGERVAYDEFASAVQVEIGKVKKWSNKKKARKTEQLRIQNELLNVTEYVEAQEQAEREAALQNIRLTNQAYAAATKNGTAILKDILPQKRPRVQENARPALRKRVREPAAATPTPPARTAAPLIPLMVTPAKFVDDDGDWPQPTTGELGNLITKLQGSTCLLAGTNLAHLLRIYNYYQRAPGHPPDPGLLGWPTRDVP